MSAIKQAAKALSASTGLPHMKALDIIASAMGYKNYNTHLGSKKANIALPEPTVPLCERLGGRRILSINALKTWDSAYRGAFISVDDCFKAVWSPSLFRFIYEGIASLNPESGMKYSDALSGEAAGLVLDSIRMVMGADGQVDIRDGGALLPLIDEPKETSDQVAISSKNLYPGAVDRIFTYHKSGRRDLFPSLFLMYLRSMSDASDASMECLFSDFMLDTDYSGVVTHYLKGAGGMALKAFSDEHYIDNFVAKSFRLIDAGLVNTPYDDVAHWARARKSEYRRMVKHAWQYSIGHDIDFFTDPKKLIARVLRACDAQPRRLPVIRLCHGNLLTPEAISATETGLKTLLNYGDQVEIFDRIVVINGSRETFVMQASKSGGGKRKDTTAPAPQVNDAPDVEGLILSKSLESVSGITVEEKLKSKVLKEIRTMQEHPDGFPMMTIERVVGLEAMKEIAKDEATEITEALRALQDQAKAAFAGFTPKGAPKVDRKLLCDAQERMKKHEKFVTLITSLAHRTSTPISDMTAEFVLKALA